MYYVKISSQGTGLTNQIFLLINGIILGYLKQHKVIVLDSFMPDFSKNILVPVSDVINIDTLNDYLLKNYDVIVVDKYKSNVSDYTVKYGTETNNVDITNEVVNDNKIYIRKNTSLNSIKGDPLYGVSKKLFVNYTINGIKIQETYPEYVSNDIVYNIEGGIYTIDFAWVYLQNTYPNIFYGILNNIKYNNLFVDKANSIINNITSKYPSKNINVLHLKIEYDSINHYYTFNKKESIENKEQFKKCVYNKYIETIKKYVNLNDINIVLSACLDNDVLNFLKDNNYTYIINEKTFDQREFNAIVDFLVSKSCNNIFIGEHVSTFSFYIMKNLGECIKKVVIDLSKMEEMEKVF